MKKIGIYSGTFDPVHVGHIEFALAAANKHKLEKVIFLPEKYPREKTNITPYEQRKAMLDIAIRNHTQLELGPDLDDSFTVETTLPKLQNIYKNYEHVFLVGSDVARTFLYRWPGLEKLLSEVYIVVGLRKEDTKKDIDAIFIELDMSARYDVMVSPKAHIAATHIRQGDHIIEDLHLEVAEYIRGHKLYSFE